LFNIAVLYFSVPFSRCICCDYLLKCSFLVLYFQKVRDVVGASAQPPSGDDECMADDERDDLVSVVKNHELILAMKGHLEESAKGQTQELIGAMKAQMQESFGKGATVVLTRGVAQLAPQRAPSEHTMAAGQEQFSPVTLMSVTPAEIPLPPFGGFNGPYAYVLDTLRRHRSSTTEDITSPQDLHDCALGLNKSDGKTD